MREWVHSTRNTQTCGRCGEAIPKGTPMVKLTIPGTRALVRCATCSGLAMPEHLPEPIMPDPLIDPVMARAAGVAKMMEELDVRLKRPTTRPAFFPHLVPVGESWSPFRDGD